VTRYHLCTWRGSANSHTVLNTSTRHPETRISNKISIFTQDIYLLACDNEIFLSSKSARPALGPTYLPIKWVPEFFPGVKRPGCEVDLLPPPSAEVKNELSYTSTPLIHHHDVDRDVTFLIILLSTSMMWESIWSLLLMRERRCGPVYWDRILCTGSVPLPRNTTPARHISQFTVITTITVSWLFIFVTFFG
jgi:hypothetical protein